MAINGARVELVTAEEGPAPDALGQLGLNYGNNRSYTNEDILNRDSYTLGMAGQADMDQSGDVAPPSSDLRTAEFLGGRVAEVAQELSIGRATLGRPANRGVSGGADNQDPEARG
jgi:NAD(P)H dehydrogenase (quinone)